MGDSREWKTTFKPSALNELRALQDKLAHQIIEKISMLQRDPQPDGMVKKQLKGYEGRVCRLRSGDFRIIYTFDDEFVSVLAVRKRDGNTYGADFDEEYLGGGETTEPAKQAAPDWLKFVAPSTPAPTEALPEPITTELLGRLRVPEEYWARLTRVESRDALFAVPGVPDELKLTVDEVLFGKGIQTLLDEKREFIVPSVQDLFRFRSGELLGFLLRLSPEQQAFASWDLEGKTPTLLEGGAGSGKSMIAVHRVAEAVRQFAAKGGATPRVLFTTYTNALVAASKQLIETLLGAKDAAGVEVTTVDKVAMKVGLPGGQRASIVERDDLKSMLDDVVKQVTFEGSKLDKELQRETLTKLNRATVLDEICSVIQANGVQSLDEYLKAPRRERVVKLSAIQRRAVWAVTERLQRLLTEKGLMTWSEFRRRVAAHAMSLGRGDAYDAVIVDEVQDLEPCAVKLMAAVCKGPGRLFVTADARQSIYGPGFDWQTVHASLAFTGNRGKLTGNFRSTAEIGEAARDYAGIESPGPAYAHHGPDPVVRSIEHPADELELLVRYLQGATRELRFGMDACAVFAPSIASAQRLAACLAEREVPATFMSGASVDLRAAGVKVLTLKSAKGLEFPIVALAGFLGDHYPALDPNATDGERSEVLARERRTMYVGMTRAMRALLVAIPAGADSTLFSGFSPKLWNVA